jgi:hypothetical protein
VAEFSPKIGTPCRFWARFRTRVQALSSSHCACGRRRRCHIRAQLLLWQSVQDFLSSSGIGTQVCAPLSAHQRLRALQHSMSVPAAILVPHPRAATLAPLALARTCRSFSPVTALGTPLDITLSHLVRLAQRTHPLRRLTARMQLYLHTEHVSAHDYTGFYILATIAGASRRLPHSRPPKTSSGRGSSRRSHDTRSATWHTRGSSLAFLKYADNETSDSSAAGIAGGYRL